MTTKFAIRPGNKGRSFAWRKEVERKYGHAFLRLSCDDNGHAVMEGSSTGLIFLAKDIVETFDRTRPHDSKWLEELFYWPVSRTPGNEDWGQLTEDSIELMILMFPPTVRLEVFSYEPEPFSSSIQPDWEAGSEMGTELDETRFTIIPNQPAALSFSKHLISLAQPNVPTGTRIRYDDPTILEAKSIPFAVEKAMCD